MFNILELEQAKVILRLQCELRDLATTINNSAKDSENYRREIFVLEESISGWACQEELWKENNRLMRENIKELSGKLSSMVRTTEGAVKEAEVYCKKLGVAESERDESYKENAKLRSAIKVMPTSNSVFSKQLLERQLYEAREQLHKISTS